MKVKKIKLVIEEGRKQKEDSKFLEGVRKIGEEIFEAIDLSYSDMEDVPTGYYEMMDLIDESYDEGDFDEAIDMMYLLSYLCDDVSRLKVEAFACVSDDTKEAITGGFVTAMRTESDDECGLYFGEDEGEEDVEWEDYCNL